MLTITVGATEVFDEKTGKFGTQGGVELQLEHSLVSLSKWEQIHEKPFLEQREKTAEEVFSYIKCMLLTPNPPEDFLIKLSKENVDEINAYINRKMTATWFSDRPGGSRSREVITADLVYYWMTLFNIPREYETRHLNSLFTLIRICILKQDKPKRMNKRQAAQQQRELNARRKAELGTKG